MKREIRFETTKAFLKRVQTTARKADKGEAIKESLVVSLPPEELSRIVTTARLRLVAVVRKSDQLSVTGLARRLERDRAAVKRDVDVLVRVGILRTKESSLPGHGRQVLVLPAARQLRLLAEI